MTRPIEKMITTTQILNGVSAGDVTQAEAIEALHVQSWAQVLNALADRGLPPPKPPSSQVEEELMAALPLMRKMEAAIHGD